MINYLLTQDVSKCNYSSNCLTLYTFISSKAKLKARGLASKIQYDLCEIEECFPKLTQFTSTRFEIIAFVFIAIYENIFDYILILNCWTLENDCLYIKRKK